MVVERLKSGHSKPRTLPALRSTIEVLFYKQMGEVDVQAVVDQMSKAGYIVVANENVSFKMTKDA